MTTLASQNCTRVSPDTVSINDTEISTYLKELKSLWQMLSDKSSINRQLSFDNFYETMAFVNAAAEIAHQQNHHPDMHIGYNYCNITFTTHSINGLSLKDFICAAKINEISA